MVTECAVSALAVIERFDVIEDLGTRLGAGVEGRSVDQLELEGAPEAFDGGVIVAVGSAAHGGDQAGVVEGLAIISAGVLDAAIGVEEQVGGRAAMQEGHSQSF